MIERALAGRSLAQVMDGARPNPLLMAETGGLNAMIVDSSALTEQVVRDAVASAFQSAGQRCSALRMLYVQKDAYSRVLKMLTGAMDTLHLGHPWQLSTDIGPVIDADAHADITSYIERHRLSGDVLHQVSRAPCTSDSGMVSELSIAPTLIRVHGIADLEREIFGPVLHLASYEAHELSGVVETINARGFGLTFGLHTRIDDRVQQVVDAIHAGNVYVNRNQIGAVVGSQPFGGEGLSGTGPKAGGPWYVARLMNRPVNPTTLPHGYREAAPGPTDPPDGLVLPGPTGESNHWRTVPRGTVLLLGRDDPATQTFRDTISSLGCHVVMEPLADMLHDSSEPLLQALQEHAATVVAAPLQDPGNILRLRQHLARSDGPLIPLVDSLLDPSHFLLERHLCIDTTAAGGNASLLGSAD
jgi:RHH-type proline utilization regulon transcriptional repressor/proline dehydrogenase/delta 1-pyrroline-5-carboxylate dehydrogenase